MSNIEEVTSLLRLWEDQNNTSQDVTTTLMKLADVFEKETEMFLKQDPDPFDDRHPSRLQPDCTFGLMLKTFFRNERIVDEIVKVYCQRDVLELNIASCRLLLDILPGLESVIFQEEGFVPRLLHWAENAPNPLQSYATGLLAAAMDTPEIAANYRERNAYFVPLMLRRLHALSERYLLGPRDEEQTIPERPFAGLGTPEESAESRTRKSKKRKDLKALRFSPFPVEFKVNHRRTNLKASPVKATTLNDCSNSSWSQIEQYVIGSYQVYPLTLAAEQRYILQYLTPMGEYQDLLGHIVEENALGLIMRFIDVRQNPDVRLAFEALKYLASLLCHKKAAIEFLNVGGLQLLLGVPFPSIAATGVSICLYYLAHIEEAMEKICSGLLSPALVSALVSYALWLLECSHDSSRCHATMFFGYAFQFHNILENFDQQDGLRKLFNVMSTLDIFVALDNARSLSDDQVFANRQTTRHVCGALKRYFEAHLVDALTPKTQNKPYKAMNLSSQNIEACMDTWHETLSPFTTLKPVDEFIGLEGITFLLDLVTSYFDVSYSGRAETIKNALDVLKICSLTSHAQMLLTEKIPNHEHMNTTGILILLQAAHGELMPTPDIQRSALHTIINCVCTRIPDVDSKNSTPNCKKKSSRSLEEPLNKLWRGVQNKNGIIILINLLSAKTPLTDADSIRALACKALCGLARSETVKQIISKLPLITEGQLLELTREPVLQDRTHRHVEFCRYSFELIERVTGAPLPDQAASGPVVNINKSEIVAKTKVVYNEAQLLHLIVDHLSAKGFSESASTLQKEISNKSNSSQMNSFGTPSRTVPGSFSSRGCRLSEQVANSPAHSVSIPPPSVPLKIVVNRKPRFVPEPKQTPTRLQKPQACSGHYVQTPAMRRGPGWGEQTQPPCVSLEGIVTEYLRKQHALCKTPMLACPPFDLFSPHKCPESRNRRSADANFLLRLHKKQMSYRNGGFGGAALDRKLIYSKFRLLRSFRDEESSLSCASFLNWHSDRPHSRLLLGTLGGLGTGGGQLKIFQLTTGEEEQSRDAHSRGVSYIETSRFNPLVLTSDNGRTSCLWKASDYEMKHTFSEVKYMEFGKLSDLRAVGTKHESAVIVDVTSCAELDEFPSTELGNGYLDNRATFDYRDELMLSDGLLYDVRSKTVVHKLDKFNATMNGVFHPNGREIVSNTEVWDMRTFKLLRTVIGLDQCRITFNEAGSVIYGIYCNREMPDEKMNCFYTFNAYDYSPIATVDVKKPILSLALDSHERYIATIESQMMQEQFLPPIVGMDCTARLYEIGRTKEEGDEDGDESDDSEEESDDDDDDNDEEVEDGQNDVSFQIEDDDDDFTETSDDDDDDALFSLNSSMED